MAESQTVTIRLDCRLVEAAELVGSLTYRSRSALMSYALQLYLEKNYPLSLQPGAHVGLLLAEAPVDPKARA